MWAIMVIRDNAWHIHSQQKDFYTARDIARKIEGMVVPWDDRILLLDNGVLESMIEFPGEKS